MHCKKCNFYVKESALKKQFGLCFDCWWDKVN